MKQREGKCSVRECGNWKAVKEGKWYKIFLHPDNYYSASGEGTYITSGRIYTSSYTNIIETLVYSKLITLSVITCVIGPSAKSALVYSLVGMVFVIMIGIIVYHIHTLYIAHSLVLGIQAKIS